MHSIKLTLFWQEWENSYSQQDGEEGVEGKIKKICNTSLAAPGARAYRLQCLQNPKWPTGGRKMADGVWKHVYP